MSNVAITHAGLNYVMDAHSSGPLIAIKYFVPVYDWRIDPTLCVNDAGGTTSYNTILEVATDTAALTIASATPYGEVLGNFTGGVYTIDNDNDYVVDGTIVGNNVNGSLTTNGPTHINTYVVGSVARTFGIYLSTSTTHKHYIKASNFTNLGDGSYSSTATPVSITADYINNSNTIANYSYPVSEYNAIVDSDGGLKGSVYCKLPAVEGTFKYNKIALIAVKIDNSGNEIAGSKCFFAEAYFNSPITKSSFGDGYDETIIDVQMTLSATGGGDWNNIFYSTSGDYWLKTPEGLHTPENISVGSNTTSNKLNEIGEATVHIGTDNISTTEQLRIDVQNTQSVYNYYHLQSYNDDTLGSVLDWDCNATSGATWIFNDIKLGHIYSPIKEVSSNQFSIVNGDKIHFINNEGISFTKGYRYHLFDVRVNDDTDDTLLLDMRIAETSPPKNFVIGTSYHDDGTPPTVGTILDATTTWDYFDDSSTMNLIAGTIKVYTSAILPYSSTSAVNLGSSSSRFNIGYFKDNLNVSNSNYTTEFRPDGAVGYRQLLLGTTSGTSNDRLIIASGSKILNTTGNDFGDVYSIITSAVTSANFNPSAKVDIIGLGGVNVYGPTTFNGNVTLTTINGKPYAGGGVLNYVTSSITNNPNYDFCTLNEGEDPDVTSNKYGIDASYADDFGGGDVGDWDAFLWAPKNAYLKTMFMVAKYILPDGTESMWIVLAMDNPYNYESPVANYSYYLNEDNTVNSYKFTLTGQITVQNISKIGIIIPGLKTNTSPVTGILSGPTLIPFTCIASSATYAGERLLILTFSPLLTLDHAFVTFFTLG